MIQNEYLIHYGVQGMKWGRRKQKVSSKRSSSSNTKKSIKQKAFKAISKVDKQRAKEIAKTTALFAGRVAIATTLGAVGSIAFNEIVNAHNARAARTTLKPRSHVSK